jgi:hypothetical protein
VVVAVLVHFMELAVLVALVAPVAHVLAAVEWAVLVGLLLLLAGQLGAVGQALETMAALVLCILSLVAAGAVLLGLVGMGLIAQLEVQ